MRRRQRTWRSIVTLAALAVIAGPQWCCCTFKSVAAETAAERCCCCESSAACSPDAPEGHPAGDEGCPCRAKLRPVAASVGGTVSSGSFDDASWARGFAASQISPGRAAIRPDDFSSPGRGWSPEGPPRLAGRALLRALSTLRC